jgi:hypothetical protein
MSDSSEVDEAVIAALAGDATLMAAMTDGVHVDVAPTGKTKFVIVSQVDHEDEYDFDGITYEVFLYLVKAVELNVSGLTVKSAAARIHTVLQRVNLTVDGYKHSMTRRVARVRYTEVDESDGNKRWQHRGGRYEVFVSPTS